VIVLAQRWVTDIKGGEEFGRQVVEALVIARKSEGDSIDCALFSAFYDPAQGQILATAFKWWERGRSGMLPGLCTLSLDVLSHWSMPADRATDLRSFVERLEALTEAFRRSVQRAEK